MTSLVVFDGFRCSLLKISSICRLNMELFSPWMRESGFDHRISGHHLQHWGHDSQTSAVCTVQRIARAHRNVQLLASHHWRHQQAITEKLLLQMQFNPTLRISIGALGRMQYCSESTAVPSRRHRAHYKKTWRRPQTRKYITYYNTATEKLSKLSCAEN